MSSSLLQGKRFYCREWAFSKLSHCLDNLATAKTCGTLIVGGPGCGKTALCCEAVWPTNSLGKQALLSKRILCHYFCQAHDIETLSLLNFIEVIVEQLGKTSLIQGYETFLEDPQLQKLLHPTVCESNPDETFKKAVLLPLCAVTPPTQNLFMIVDSVDESYLQYINDRTDGSRTIAELLANNHQFFPPWLLLVCTARKQSKTVTRKFTGFRKISLDDLSKSHVVRDVQQYILYRLDQEEELRQHLSRDTAEMLNQLHIKSNGCFLYLERVLDGVAESFIRLREITEIPGTLNGLYLWLCQRIFAKKHFDLIRPILNVILAARRPLTEMELFSCAYTRNNALLLDEFQEQMGIMSKILIEGKDSTKIVFHHSFAEWLLDVKHCTQKYLCTAAEGHGMLAMSFTMHALSLSPLEIQDFALHIVKSNMSPPFEGTHLSQWLIQSGAYIEESLSVGLPKEQAVLELLTNAGAKLPTPSQNPELVSTSKLVTTEEDALQMILKMGTPIDALDTNGRTMLHNASHEGNLQALKVLVGKGSNVELADKSGQTSLNIAARQGHTLPVVALIKADANLNHTDAEGWTALRSAAWGGHSEVVKVLLEAGAQVDHADSDDRTALRAAAWGGHDNIVLNLLNYGASVNKCDKEGRTPLIAASYMGHANIVRHLLEWKVDINHQDIDGRTALSVAALCIPASEGHAEVVRILLDNNARADHQDKDGMTPLIVAAYEGHREVCELLLEDDADVDHTDNSGRCALQAAVSMGHTPVVELLMFWGCYTDMIDVDGRTVLCLACQQGNVEVVRLLLDRGMDELHRDNSGWTPAHFAAFEGHKEVLDSLIEVGAKLTEVDNEGRIPLILASQEGHLAAVRRLVEASSNIESKPHDGKTALRVAALEGHKDVVEYLISVDADFNYKDADGRSTLYVLALENNLLVANTLLESKADVSGTDLEGRTTLHVAAWQGHHDMVKLLIKHNADLNAIDNDSRSVLQSSAWQGHAKVVRLLLESGALVDHACNQGATALCIAAQEGHEDVVRILLEFTANPNHADQCGRTATRVAMKGGHINVVRLLEEYGAIPTSGTSSKQHGSNSTTTTSGIATTIDSKNSSQAAVPGVITGNSRGELHNLNCNNSAYESPGSTFDRKKSCLSNNSSKSNLTGGNATNTGSTNQSSCSEGLDNSGSLTKQAMSFTQQLQQCSRNKNRPISKTLTPVSEPYFSPVHDNSTPSGSPMSDVIVQGSTGMISPLHPSEPPKTAVNRLTSPRLEFSSANISISNKSSCGTTSSNSHNYHRIKSVPTIDDEPVWQMQSESSTTSLNAAKVEMQRRGMGNAGSNATAVASSKHIPDMPPMVGSGIAMGQMSLALKSPETRRKRNGIVTNPNLVAKASSPSSSPSGLTAIQQQQSSSSIASNNKNVSINGYFNKLSDLDFFSLSGGSDEDLESTTGTRKTVGSGAATPARPTGLAIKKETPL